LHAALDIDERVFLPKISLADNIVRKKLSDISEHFFDKLFVQLRISLLQVDEAVS
jgi:hypothetical protein